MGKSLKNKAAMKVNLILTLTAKPCWHIVQQWRWNGGLINNNNCSMIYAIQGTK
jgi:hypothetical protein